MPTGTKKGLTPSRMVGSGGDNRGLSSYPIASGYASSIGLGDPVKLSSGTIVLATNDTADAIGVFAGVKYTDSEGTPQFKKSWTASTTGTDIEALVDDNPFRTFTAKADGPVPLVTPGDIFAMSGIGAPDANTGRSTALVKALTEVSGTVDIEDVTDLGADITTISDTDTFTIRTSQVTAGAAVTITIENGDSAADLLDKLNAVDNITATYNSSGYLTIVASDGYDLVLTDGTGTPLADAAAAGLIAPGTYSEVVAASAGLVKVIKVTDPVNYELEVVLVDHDLRDDG